MFNHVINIFQETSLTLTSVKHEHQNHNMTKILTIQKQFFVAMAQQSIPL